MKDLTSPFWIKLKGGLFLLVGIMAALLVILEHPTWQVAVYLAVAIWCFCRAYYFAFYVLEKYVDPGFKFSGLGSALAYLFKRSKRDSSRLPSTKE